MKEISKQCHTLTFGGNSLPKLKKNNFFRTTSIPEVSKKSKTFQHPISQGMKNDRFFSTRSQMAYILPVRRAKQGETATIKQFKPYN